MIAVEGHSMLYHSAQVFALHICTEANMREMQIF